METSHKSLHNKTLQNSAKSKSFTSKSNDVEDNDIFPENNLLFSMFNDPESSTPNLTKKSESLHKSYEKSPISYSSTNSTSVKTMFMDPEVKPSRPSSMTTNPSKIAHNKYNKYKPVQKINHNSSYKNNIYQSANSKAKLTNYQEKTQLKPIKTSSNNQKTNRALNSMLKRMRTRNEINENAFNQSSGLIRDELLNLQKRIKGLSDFQKNSSSSSLNLKKLALKQGINSHKSLNQLSNNQIQDQKLERHSYQPPAPPKFPPGSKENLLHTRTFMDKTPAYVDPNQMSFSPPIGQLQPKNYRPVKNPNEYHDSNENLSFYNRRSSSLKDQLNAQMAPSRNKSANFQLNNNIQSSNIENNSYTRTIQYQNENAHPQMQQPVRNNSTFDLNANIHDQRNRQGNYNPQYSQNRSPQNYSPNYYNQNNTYNKNPNYRENQSDALYNSLGRRYHSPLGNQSSQFQNQERYWKNQPEQYYPNREMQNQQYQALNHTLNRIPSQNISTSYQPRIQTRGELQTPGQYFSEMQNQSSVSNLQSRDDWVIEKITEIINCEPVKKEVLKILYNEEEVSGPVLLRGIKKTGRFMGAVTLGIITYNLIELFGSDLISRNPYYNNYSYKLSNEFRDLYEKTLAN